MRKWFLWFITAALLAMFAWGMECVKDSSALSDAKMELFNEVETYQKEHFGRLARIMLDLAETDTTLMSGYNRGRYDQRIENAQPVVGIFTSGESFEVVVADLTEHIARHATAGLYPIDPDYAEALSKTPYDQVNRGYWLIHDIANIRRRALGDDSPPDLIGVDELRAEFERKKQGVNTLTAEIEALRNSHGLLRWE